MEIVDEDYNSSENYVGHVQKQSEYAEKVNETFIAAINNLLTEKFGRNYNSNDGLASRIHKMYDNNQMSKMAMSIKMVDSIISACIHHKKDSVSKEEIKEFYGVEFYSSFGFEESFKQNLIFMVTHSFNGVETYSIDLSKKHDNGMICGGYSISSLVNFK